MLYLIALILLICSLTGLGIIIRRKIPVLLELPETAPVQFDFKIILSKIKSLSVFEDFSAEMFLHKILSKIRVLTLKFENKTSNWLQRLRQKSLKKKFSENDKYWQEIKDSTEDKPR
ncbi:MAG: hypothetical protein A2175_02525 [Candidatus Nealsonbacteria bacterium RBG_13_42_11]|uniref:Uncharacterized protein n=1 Tax=Candidatus Nealsonbacteria bacterium RBG_13_42_11 TaxID=1801663 RepID=A0A1G2DYD9_9BACT|nr:MAG: hypothetical protein A2175_02525 [Candidatus Nealsonbacteria bacterium RBG_13_42_11]